MVCSFECGGVCAYVSWNAAGVSGPVVGLGGGDKSVGEEGALHG